MKSIMDNEDIIGIDICGEPSENISYLQQKEEFIRDDRVNEDLADFCIKECVKDIDLVK